MFVLASSTDLLMTGPCCVLMIIIFVILFIIGLIFDFFGYIINSILDKREDKKINSMIHTAKQLGKYCPKCGRNIPKDSRWCPYCFFRIRRYH